MEFFEWAHHCVLFWCEVASAALCILCLNAVCYLYTIWCWNTLCAAQLSWHCQVRTWLYHSSSLSADESKASKSEREFQLVSMMLTTLEVMLLLLWFAGYLCVSVLSLGHAFLQSRVFSQSYCYTVWSAIVISVTSVCLSVCRLSVTLCTVALMVDVRG